MRHRRKVAIELGTCRSGRNGGSSGSIIIGNGNLRDERGGTRSRGGNRLLFGDQESVRRNAQRGMMVEPAPSATLIVIEPDFLLELLVVAFDAPAHFSEIDQAVERRILRKVRKPVF